MIINTLEDYEKDSSYIHKEDAKPVQISGDLMSNGNLQTFPCPACSSYNTIEGIYFEECRTCGWSQSY